MKLNKIIKQTLRIVIANIIFLASIPAVSAIPYRTAFEEYDLINAETKELNLSLLAKIQIVIDQNRFNMSHYVPLKGLPQNDSGEVIGRRILKHTLQTWFDDSNSMQVSTNVSSGWIRQVGTAGSSFSKDLDARGGKLSFRLRPIETTAEVSYTSSNAVKAVFAYDANESEATLEVSKKYGDRTYAYSHVNNSDESKNLVGVRWNF